MVGRAITEPDALIVLFVAPEDLNVILPLPLLVPCKRTKTVVGATAFETAGIAVAAIVVDQLVPFKEYSNPGNSSIEIPALRFEPETEKLLTIEVVPIHLSNDESVPEILIKGSSPILFLEIEIVLEVLA